MPEPEQDPKQKKKKRRRCNVLICTTYTKFDLVKRVAKQQGMREAAYHEPWNILWTDFSVSINRVRTIKSFQRVNHFPSMVEICHKVLLAKNLNRMLRLFPQHYKFFPRTWCFPAEFTEALDFSKRYPGRTYIMKPGAGCRGQGIHLTKVLRQPAPTADKVICQLYLSRPFLMDGLKFDLRLYALITSVDPLRIYVYNEGLARFATTPYKRPGPYNLTNSYMHLTNYSVNKFSSSFISEGDAATKRSLSAVNDWLNKNLYNTDDIWSRIDDVIIKTIIAAHPMVKNSYQVSFPLHQDSSACFEILGFDIMLDDTLKPFLLEVNSSPSFNTDCEVDRRIKEALLEDTFRILNLCSIDTQQQLLDDKRRSQQRLGTDLREVHGDGLEAVRKAASEAQDRWELSNLGNYRRVYPANGNTDKYGQFFLTSQVIETLASKAREEATARIKHNIEMKKNEEEERERERQRKTSPRANLASKLCKQVKKIPTDESQILISPERDKSRSPVRRSEKPKRDSLKMRQVVLKMDSEEEEAGGEEGQWSRPSSPEDSPLVDISTAKQLILTEIYKRLKECGYVEQPPVMQEVQPRPRPSAKHQASSLQEQQRNQNDQGHSKEHRSWEEDTWEGYHSSAAQEFLRFQKANLLKKLQEMG